ncbi:nucleotidyltransferase family protein [Pedobacter nototheniae]|uniref:nucleotidyltransferase family protein n=1 Tax=Pedobacter nototheniae TaxID=2488994 RepID=UPI00292FF0C7|nr:nucleotidyltransferase family protein [Pedobacter nototheniae]
MNTAIIILAAGNSSRMGKPKQLLKFNGQTLLELVTNQALKTSCRPIIVVLGAYADEIRKQHHHLEVIYVFNEDWEKGMSSSIAKGVTKTLENDILTENVIITVADQVYIDSTVLEKLVVKHQSNGKSIVTCTYAQTTGTPTLFNKKHFEELLNLDGQSGAKTIIKNHPEDLATVNFEAGAIDIDTETDYNKIINLK